MEGPLYREKRDIEATRFGSPDTASDSHYGIFSPYTVFLFYFKYSVLACVPLGGTWRATLKRRWIHLVTKTNKDVGLERARVHTMCWKHIDVGKCERVRKVNRDFVVRKILTKEN